MPIPPTAPLEGAENLAPWCSRCESDGVGLDLFLCDGCLNLVCGDCFGDHACLDCELVTESEAAA